MSEKTTMTTKEALTFLGRGLTTLRHHTRMGSLHPTFNDRNQHEYPVAELKALRDRINDRVKDGEYLAPAAAEYVGISPHTFNKHVSRGNIVESRRSRGRLVFTRAALDEFRKEHTRAGQEE